ncbi:PREDICTED: rab GTPase-binding effector protein 1 [Ceratosolen solmsi marchali]|uniref:Rab GTPase-binding effector protein 1 n=1 Tax=Ceratosolen solmsi marchali TaxID=326594 RepID=A0AAJ6YRB6_9HYME|nr:PREDICTED: rab GTPase-binding effector protein 1 [Ceratosolen solmsi marchali]
MNSIIEDKNHEIKDETGIIPDNRLTPLKLYQPIKNHILNKIIIRIYNFNNFIDVYEKVRNLEATNNQIREEFDVQRGKLKELFLQKEEDAKNKIEENLKLQEENSKLIDELNDIKSQLVIINIKTQNDIDFEKRKAEDEIASLQQIIASMVQDSSTTRNKLENKISKLKEENNSLRLQIMQNLSIDGPQISLTTMTKTLAKKVASQLGADSLSLSSENEDSSSKNKRHADEDAEVLRSLVVPLEEEITALKEKLRTTDDELQKCKEKEDQQNRQFKIKEMSGSSENTCDMCTNYEAQLQRMQMEAKDLRNKLQEFEQILYNQKQDLTKEVEFRKGMEEKWNEKKEEFKAEVINLTSSVKLAKKTIDELKQQYQLTKESIKKKLYQLTKERDQVQKHLEELQQQNDYLMGKYSKHSEHYQYENINMPNNIEELHLSILKIREELVVATIAKEETERKSRSFEYELDLLRKKKEQVNQEKKKKELELQYMIENASKTDLIIAELKQQITNLQQELNTGEQTQKDFVRLTQSLQVQLQKIRDSEKEVRWQFEDDVDECPTCHTSFILVKKKEKMHCRHCGQIFCHLCLNNVVKSGPKQRPSKVCNVCHTLLVQETAPYFSRDPP